MEVAIIISFMSMLAIFITIFLSFKAINELATDFLETNKLLQCKYQEVVEDRANLREICNELRMQKIKDEKRTTQKSILEETAKSI